MKILALSSADVLASCSMASAIEAMRRAFHLYDRGGIVAPLRTRLAVTRSRNFLAMAAMMRTGWNPISVKLVNVDPHPPPGRDAVTATVILLGGNGGGVRAIMDGGALTALRTGAASGLSCRYLARRDSTVLGIIGAGGQALQQISGVCAERQIEKVKVFSRHRAGSEALVKKVKRHLSVDAEAKASADLCAKGSDVIITATTSTTPVLTRSMVDEGTHVIAMGAYTPESREVDSALVRGSSVYVDSGEAALAEAGDILIPLKERAIGKNHLRGDLAGLVSGRTEGRRNEKELTLFKSVGLAFEDTAVAALVYKEAARKHRGKLVGLW